MNSRPNATEVVRPTSTSVFLRWIMTKPMTICTALGLPAALPLRAPDDDGGFKCWVRFDEGNRLDVVPGSRVVKVER